MYATHSTLNCLNCHWNNNFVVFCDNCVSLCKSGLSDLHTFIRKSATLTFMLSWITWYIIFCWTIPLVLCELTKTWYDIFDHTQCNMPTPLWSIHSIKQKRHLSYVIHHPARFDNSIGMGFKVVQMSGQWKCVVKYEYVCGLTDTYVCSNLYEHMFLINNIYGLILFHNTASGCMFEYAMLFSMCIYIYIYIYILFYNELHPIASSFTVWFILQQLWLKTVDGYICFHCSVFFDCTLSKMMKLRFSINQFPGAQYNFDAKHKESNFFNKYII